MVDDELAGLPHLDDRYRLWPWSLGAVARRRGRSRTTVHNHVRALREAGVLVTDDERWPWRTVVDTFRLDELRPDGIHEAGRCRRGRADGGTSALGGVEPPATAEALVGVIEALTVVLEARSDLVEALGPALARLAQILAAETAKGAPVDVRAYARLCGAIEARDCAPKSEERERSHII